MSKLFIISTPIGNLKDVTFRAVDTLKEVDFILAEDTRVTKKLLMHYKIAKPLISYHQYSKLKKVDDILSLLREGKILALVSDAGTPGISDPGNKLVAEILKSKLNVEIIPIPGVSSITAIASVAGISMDSFTFSGFSPHKKGKNKFLKKALDSDIPVIFFESPHRILKTLEQLKSLITHYLPAPRFKSGQAGALPQNQSKARFTARHITDYELIIGRELTKKFETIYRGTVDEVLTQLKKDIIKGEFTVILYKAC